ncbi:MAG: aminopeptidase P family protein, partial [Nannocystaceae bacterium]
CEPGAILVLRPDHPQPFTLFVAPKNPDAERWNGRRVGPDQACSQFGADASFAHGELAKHLPNLLDGVKTLWAPYPASGPLGSLLTAATRNLRSRNRSGYHPPVAYADAHLMLGEDRMVKDRGAMASLRRAIELSAAGHVAAMQHCRPGMHEYEIEALVEYTFRRHGSSGPGYASIVGGGNNATVLHYIDNNAQLNAGDLLLIDAGAEWDYFTGDITRTFPISGRFTPAQRDAYEVVLAANRAGIAHATTTGTIDGIHEVCLRVLCEGMRALKLVQGSLDEILERGLYKPFYMHKTNHWLGVDVHDAGYYCVDTTPRRLEPGFVLTVEPGLYIDRAYEDVPEELRGLGIRIEDDVLVTSQGPEVLTAAAPKDADEIEALVGSAG